MKRKQIERVERRRSLVDLNLLGEAKARARVGAKGCASLLGRILIDAAVLVVLVAGLQQTG